MEWSSYDGHHITSIPSKHSNLLLPFTVGIWCLRCLSLAHPPLVVTLCYIRGQGGSDFQKVLRFRLLTRGESLSLAHSPLVMTLWSDLIMICQIAWLHLIWELLNEKHPRPVDNLQDLIVLHHNTPHHIWLSYHLLMTSRTSRTSQCYIIIIISPVYDLQDLQKAPTPHREGA